MSQRRDRPGFGAVITNWRTYDAPVLTKLRLALANSLAKLRTRASCCGHPGQPGC